MSFKREGDDKDQLGVLRQRRIRDLIGENIPEDEAKLLSSGKFTCMMCFHRPIFDSIDILLVHRSGKKHEQGAKIFAEKQRELKNLIEVRKAEHYEKYGNTNIKIAKEHLNNRHLMTSSPYDARSRKVKPYDRKPKIHVGTMSGSSFATDTSKLTELPGHGGRWGHLQSTETIMHDAQLKNIFRKRENKCDDIRPYISKRQETDEQSSSSSTHPVTIKNTNKPTSYNDTQSVEIISTFCTVPNDVNESTSISQPPQPSDMIASNTNVSKIVTEEQTLYVNKIQQLRGAGWKRDWDGKWIKDEDAEFDSDEEPPDL